MENTLLQTSPMLNIAHKAATTSRNYDFVDAIRGISMMFIVIEHSIYFQPDVYNPTGLRAFVYLLLIQLSKFGTVCFFLLAGFLIGEKFTDYSPLQYLKRRANNTIWPWLIWSLLFIVFTNSELIINLFRSGPSVPADNTAHLLTDIKTTYLYTIYWFIPNFLFCITLLLIFKKYLYKYYLGLTFAMFTVFYSINIYFSWIQPSHTTAIFGFVFFLWLGAQFNNNWQKLNQWINKTPTWLWLALSVITLLFGVFEINLLKSLHNADPYNSLRISNILFSLSCFFLLFKIRHFKWINTNLKPRETTFGIYLIHYILVAYLLAKVFGPLNINLNGLALPLLVLYQLIRFLFVYVIVIFIVKAINKTNFKWVIGR